HPDTSSGSAVNAPACVPCEVLTKQGRRTKNVSNDPIAIPIPLFTICNLFDMLISEVKIGLYH
ncbi:MAG TPA: hypothetical protein VHX42_02370, partial [Candidatus Babeliales bacterium]|nr:hypothetical protein [Candidatus Babeliales bacterium]